MIILLSQLIFRYDNAPHHQYIASFPHHKHEMSETNVIASKAPELLDILGEINVILSKQ